MQQPKVFYPLVSIIIPVYNGEHFLSAAVESALQQTWPNKEIIIIDDGSTDGSLSIAKSYESRLVTVVSVVNGGAAKARNIGFHYAKGDYIQYLDADDLMVSNKIELQMDRFLKEAEPQKVLCAGQWIRFDSTIANIQGGIGPGGAAGHDMEPLDWLLLRPYNLMTVHGWLTPRQLIEKAGPWNEAMTLDDDGEFFIRVVSAASKVLSCKGALAYYRTIVNKDSLSHYAVFDYSPTNCEKLKSAYKSLETYRRVLYSYGRGNVKKVLARNFLYMAFNSYLVCDDVFERCIRAPEIPFFQRFLIYKWMKGKFGLLVLLVGWRNAKRLMVKFVRTAFELILFHRLKEVTYR